MQNKRNTVAAERRGTTVYIDGVPTLFLESPIATRPQDWTPTQAALIFSEAELARSKERR